MIVNDNQKDKRKIPARNYQQLQLEKVAKQKAEKKKALDKLIIKMRKESSDNGETLFKR